MWDDVGQLRRKRVMRAWFELSRCTSGQCVTRLGHALTPTVLEGGKGGPKFSERERDSLDRNINHHRCSRCDLYHQYTLS